MVFAASKNQMALGPSSKPTKVIFLDFGSNLDSLTPSFRTHTSDPNSWRWDILGFSPVQASCGILPSRAFVGAQFQRYAVWVTASAHRNEGRFQPINIVWTSLIRMQLNHSATLSLSILANLWLLTDQLLPIISLQVFWCSSKFPFNVSNIFLYFVEGFVLILHE